MYDYHKELNFLKQMDVINLFGMLQCDEVCAHVHTRFL